MKKTTQGFTLIELLVVVAIIGILAAIVMVSLGTTRAKGVDAAIESTLANMRAQGELYHSVNDNFGSNASDWSGECPTSAVASSTSGLMGESNPGLLALNTGLVLRAGSSNTLCMVTAEGTAWAVAATLKSDATQVSCVDSTGVVNTSVVTLASSITAGKCN